MSEQKDTNLWDLLKLFFNWLGNACRWLLLWFGQQIRITFRKWYIVIPVTLLGIVLGFMYSRYDNRRYKAEGMAILNGPLATEVKEAVAPLTLAMPKHIAPDMTLKERLGLTQEQADGLLEVKAHFVVDCLNDSTPDRIDSKDTHNLTDTLNVVSNRYIAFELCTKNLQNLAEVENALVCYLNNNPVLKAKYEAGKATLEEELNICDRQLQYLDSLSQIFYFKFPQGMQIETTPYTSTMIVGRRSVDVLHEDILELVQHRKFVAEDLSTYVAPIVMINHIVPVPKAVNNRLLCLIVGCLLGWIFGLIIAWTIEYRKALGQWLSTK